MGKLSRKEALKLCAEMWDAVAEEHRNGEYYENFNVIKGEVWKRLWPRANDYGGLYCWACSYSEQHHGYCGDKCIMSSAWPLGCEDASDSLWCEYQRANIAEEAMEVAMEIANKAREELKRLEREKNG